MEVTVDQLARERFGRRLIDATNGAFEVAATYLGLRLGLYSSLADDGPATSAELATRTATNERLVREWLEQQAATEFLEASRDGDGWHFALPAAHAAILLDPDAMDGMAGTVLDQVASLSLAPRLVESFRTGLGIPFADYGADMSAGQADSTRPVYRTELALWLAAIPDPDGYLTGGSARVLDVGCGFGWSSIELARALPGSHVDGVDLDPASIEAARDLATTEGLTDRVRFEVRDAAELAGAGYDLVTMFEMLHDVARPVRVLEAARKALAPGGRVLVADELTSEAFDGPADETDRRHYGWSIIHCLPASMTEPGSAATGTVMRPSTLRAYASAAGFSAVDVLAVDSVAFRLYLLRP
jgi:2-polyprenyl-3-methyl-5-hydroxy-6-metoxy-1,4-benzoquinol methylase